MKNEKKPSGPRRVPVNLTTEVQKDVERLAREANVTPSQFVEMMVGRDVMTNGMNYPLPHSKRRGKRTQGTTRFLRLHSETAVAVDDMMIWLESVTKGALVDTPRSKAKCLNAIIRAACEAVMNYEPHKHTSECVNFMDLPTGNVIYSWPPAFDARAETPEELDVRLVLQRMSAGEIDGAELNPSKPDL